jgi:hypothetical protein
MSPLPPSKEPPLKGPQICRQRHEGDLPRVDLTTAPAGMPSTPRQLLAPDGGGDPAAHPTTSTPIALPKESYRRPLEAHATERREGCHRHDGAPPERQRGARGEERGMDEPHRRLHGTTLRLCRRRSPTVARRESRGGVAARVRAPHVSPLESDAGPCRASRFVFRVAVEDNVTEVEMEIHRNKLIIRTHVRIDRMTSLILHSRTPC